MGRISPRYFQKEVGLSELDSSNSILHLQTYQPLDLPLDPNLLEKKIRAIIGCNSMPASRETGYCTEDCKVVFGYYLTLGSEKVDKETAMTIPNLTFPTEMPEIIFFFLKYFQLANPPKKSDSQSKKRIKRSITDMPLEPELISFVRK